MIARIVVALACTLATGCTALTGVDAAPCTLARATSADTLGWSIRANGDTAGPIVAWTCDPRIHLTRVRP